MLMGLASEISNQKEFENVGNSSGFMAEEIFPPEKPHGTT